MPPRERGQQGGVSVEDAVREGTVDGLGHHGAEARHRHQVDLVGDQRGGHGRRERVAVEVGPEASVERPVDELGRRAMLLGQGEGGTGPVGQDDTDRKSCLQHRPQDRAGTRDENRETHGLNLVPHQPGVRAGPDDGTPGHGAPILS